MYPGRFLLTKDLSKVNAKKLWVKYGYKLGRQNCVGVIEVVKIRLRGDIYKR